MVVDGPGLGNLSREDWESIAKGFTYVDPQLPRKVRVRLLLVIYLIMIFTWQSYTSCDPKKPYEEPLVAWMLHAIYFSKPSSLGNKLCESLPEYDEKKAVTNAMVAFVSTAVCNHA